jgi:signal transduction histidine kinase
MAAVGDNHVASPPALPATSDGRAPLRRDPERAVVAGVAAGVGRWLGVDPLAVRIAFVLATLAGGWGVLVYLGLWAALPSAGDRASTPAPFRTGRSAVEVSAGAALVLLAALLFAREAGLWASDALVWPLVLVAGGAALLWRQSLADGAADAGAHVTAPLSEDPAARRARRTAVLSRNGLGVALVLAAGVVFLSLTGTLEAGRDVALAAVVVAVVLALILAPFVTRLVRSLAAERASRIREQERAEMAAHLHDSVLQTLALMQQRAGDPREVATLARRQERELRAWLGTRARSAEPAPGRTPAGAASRRTLAGALEEAASEVEEAHRVAVEVVAVGEAALDERGEALVAAAREAMVNAAKFGGGGPVRVFAEAGGDALAVFVRDRGPGFDPATVPRDRRGVRESVVGRMARHGGHATIGAVPGGGTEVELVLPRAAP